MIRTYAVFQQLLAEMIGTLLLVCCVIGSGIMGERLANGNLALALLANTFATVCVLYVLIDLIQPISGAHFNPLVTLFASQQSPYLKCGFMLAQSVGAIAGALLANGMFELP